MIRVLVGSGNFQPARPILDSLTKAHSVSRIADSMIRAFEGSDSCQSSTLSFVVERSSHNGLSIEGLEVFRKMRMCGLRPSVDACNALLDALQREDEITLAWCIYVGMIRAHVLERSNYVVPYCSNFVGGSSYVVPCCLDFEQKTKVPMSNRATTVGKPQSILDPLRVGVVESGELPWDQQCAVEIQFK
ncbi:hypothetical protein NL676_007442 [Syzygium grande]|nr:hypothetical protein NL676_007442 [Syzygium grande]